MKSLHLIGSNHMGGAERWFTRFLAAMLRQGEDVEAAVRRGSELARHHMAGIPHHELPFRTVWDPLSRYAVSQLIAASDTPIVQTYMGRATRLTRLKRGRGRVHISRLGGYYKLDPFRHAHAWIGNTKGLCDWMIRGGLPAARVFHITNFADPVKPVDAAELDALAARIDLRPEDWLMVTAGRLIEVKGHRYLVDAMGRQGALHHSIRAVWDSPPFVGSALPVWTTARDNLAPYAALTVARPGDVIVITGKGHETYQILPTGKIHFDDREVAREAMDERKKLRNGAGRKNGNGA